MDVVVQHAPRFSPVEAEDLAARIFGTSGKAEPLASERDQNFRLVDSDGRAFVLKIANATEQREILDFQNAALAHLATRSQSLLVPAVVLSLSGAPITSVPGADGGEHLVRLLTWVPGTVLARHSPHSEELLVSLGRRLGEMDRAFAGFSHPSMRRPLPWDLTGTPWIAAEAHRFEQICQRELIERTLDRFREVVLPRLDGLRRQVVHNDWNDHNVLVGPADVVGAVDFGDMIYSCTVADLATASAYAMMGKPDPIAAGAAIVRGYHESLPLTDEELHVLYDLICARLAISVTMTACQLAEAPGNEYLRISERGAWALLEQLAASNPTWAYFAFRHACGLPACPTTAALTAWLAANRDGFAPVMGYDLRTTPVVVLDLSVGSLDIPRPEIVQQTSLFSAHVDEVMRRSAATIGVGRYDEARLVYVTDLFRHTNNWYTENRTIHLGLDLFCPAGSPVYAPLDGVVHSIANNAAAGDYGPTIILEHRVDRGRLQFFTLYGHLSLESLSGLEPGKAVRRGDRLAWLGDPSVNGGWPPHLHIQIITDLLGRSGEFPGVAAPGEREIWLSLCPDANLIAGVPEERFPATPRSADALLDARRRRLGRNLSISYRRPIAMARGVRQYLFDRDGRRFVDCVNNVPHVGHNHPRVVEAAVRQLAVLNTNTRYLHESIVDYSERLGALMPEPLGVCFLVNSGSEANELALRLARAYTGHRDMVVVDHAYHGNTTSLVELSPYKFDGPGGTGAPPHVHKVVMPDVYRGPYRAADPQAGVRYGHEVRRAIERAESSGRRVAAFISESILGCGGQIVLPAGYLREAYAAVRAAGGVAIADEVQVGFGRVGTNVWGFETQGVTPDIVTLGKPIGNGFPLGAVVTRPEIADAFDNGMEYFNTFGGTQVACGAGLAVLDVMRDEALQPHALEVGTRLRRGLEGLMDRFSIIGDVRGLGLFLGVEMVRDRETLEPAAAEAEYVVNRLRDRGLLVSTDGPMHNVLKIKPPMPFSAEDADALVTALGDVLGESGAQVCP
jgi:4-aminobutyrate aminotransferase-like enzyme/Ser/Thr protein kinase RdoA (MazF antagonist)